MIEGYAELREVRDTSRRGMSLLVQLADLGNALKTLPTWEYEVVLLHGLLGYLNVEEILDMDRETLLARYRQATQRMTDYLNGSEADRT